MWRDEDVCVIRRRRRSRTLLGARGVGPSSGLAGFSWKAFVMFLTPAAGGFDALVEATDVEPQVESSFVGTIPDFELVDEHCSSGDELIQALLLVDIRWKLDMLMAAGDVVADL